MVISVWGAIFGLSIAIVLIALRVAPAYGLIAGAFLGGLIGGADPKTVIGLMTEGAQSIVPATLRIITAGVLAGVLIESGAAVRIARSITDLLGQRFALPALAVATMLLTAVGVFIDIAVITVSPIALALARSTNCSRFVVLFAMIGGGKAGNVISPNPNTIAAAEAFKVEIPSLMAANIIPALFGLAATFLIAGLLRKGGETPEPEADDCTAMREETPEHLPQTWAAILGPLTAIALLSLRPLARLFSFQFYEIDPMIALPVGGIVGCLAMGQARQLVDYTTSGLRKMTGVAILLLGTGTLAGIIKGSTLSSVLEQILRQAGLDPQLLAPISGIFMSAATASTTAGTAVASETFGASLLASGVGAMAAAAMIHAGATVLDHLPHGSFFHATGGAVGMKFSERLRLIPFESTVGLVLVGVSTLLHGFLFNS